MDGFEPFSIVKAITFSFIACLFSPYVRSLKLNITQVLNLTFFQFSAYGGLYYASDLIFIRGVFSPNSVDKYFPRLTSLPLITFIFSIVVPLSFLFVSKYITKKLIAKEGRIAMDNVFRHHKMDPSIIDDGIKTHEINFIMTPMLEAILYFLLWGVITIIYASLIAYSNVLKA